MYTDWPSGGPGSVLYARNFSAMMLRLAFGADFLFSSLMALWVEKYPLFSLTLSIVSLITCRSNRRAKSGMLGKVAAG